MAFVESSRSQLPAISAARTVIGPPGTNNPQPAPDETDAGEEEGHKPVPERQYDSAKKRLVNWIEDHNLARHLDRDVLREIGQLVVREFDIDNASIAEWKEEAERALEFATQKAQEKQYPWPKASNIIWPLITQAALQFSALAYPALIENRNIARGTVWGSDDGTPATKTGAEQGAPVLHPEDNQPVWLIPPGAKAQRATRIGEHMSHQLLVEMPEWEPQTDTLLLQLPIIGGAVRKTYRDPSSDQNCSVLVSLMDVVWNFNAPSFEGAPRVTELVSYYPHEITQMERADSTFLPLVYGISEIGTEDGEAPDPNDTLGPREFLEQHRRYDLDGDGYEEPLTITVHRATQRAVRIVARFDEESIVENSEGKIQRVDPVDYYTLYRFLPNPKGGSYPVGFGHLLKPLNEAINTTLNQMFDAGHLQIAGGGFIGTSLSIASGQVNFQMGEYKPVNNKGQSIRDAVFPIPWPGPSAVLFQLLGTLIQAGKDVASTSNIISGDPSLANIQPTTLLALIEQGMKLYTSIYKRVWRALKEELAKLHRLNRLYLDKRTRFRVGEDWKEVSPDDYRLGGGVEPVADPNMVTDMQKITRAMIVAAFKDDPFVDPIEARRRLFEAAKLEKIDKLLREPQPDPGKQLEQANLQADLGRKRAAEMKDFTQAYLNMAQTRKFVNEAELAYLEHQTDAIRVHIEALNTQVRAADVDAKFYGHNVKLHAAQSEARAAGAESAARSAEAAEARTPPAQPPSPLPVAPVGAHPFGEGGPQ